MLAWAKDDQPASLPPPAALAKALEPGTPRGFRTRPARRHPRRSATRTAPAVDRRDPSRPPRPARRHRGRRPGRRRDTIPAQRGSPLHTACARGGGGAPRPGTPRLLPGPAPDLRSRAMGAEVSTEILDLKVADIACGSGAFLVAAARYLGEQARRGLASRRHRLFPPHELETKALREVVAHCLYGADINAMAVEMCKLSLWLVSLDRDLPFSFVDDKVLRGNSLLGLTSLRQLEALHISPSVATAAGPISVERCQRAGRTPRHRRTHLPGSLAAPTTGYRDRQRDPQRTARPSRAR